jgi:hypothetical protein
VPFQFGKASLASRVEGIEVHFGGLNQTIQARHRLIRDLTVEIFAQLALPSIDQCV